MSSDPSNPYSESNDDDEDDGEVVQRRLERFCKDKCGLSLISEKDEDDCMDDSEVEQSFMANLGASSRMRDRRSSN